MTHQFDGYNYLIRLDRGELLVDSLGQFCRQTNLTGAYLSGIGGAAWAELGFYDLVAQAYKWQKLNQLMEITNLQGTLAWEGDQPSVHLHATLTDSGLQAIGGHVKELAVGGTCEIFVHIWNKDRLERAVDESTGLKLLDV